MKTYTIELTRTITSTESVEVEIEAATPEEAREKVLALPDECNASCPEGVSSDSDEIGDWSVEAVNSDEADQAECLEILLGRKGGLTKRTPTNPHQNTENTMNTRIEYSYRDGANYKQFGHIVITGEVSQQQVTKLREACMQEDGHAYFVPESVGIARLSTGAWDNEIDHPFHILGDVTLDSLEATDSRTIYDLIADFEEKNWEEEAVSHPGENAAFSVMPIQRTDAKAVANIMQ